MRMWQTILLGKLTVFILSAIVVGGYCVSRPWYQAEMTMSETWSWIGAGAFFLLLGVASIGTIILMFRKHKPKA